ncbi:LuxR C-terminal-related transcriptional regulator [uncultured Erythrobacter sp.]|uniref:response regulator transcription factor n=1 Tax=uncultured Erythrobacter sp. TaxID=263913 RepID=UPI002620C8B3|nr:LuxR C-terminal-related transcriptional regulator [uncultured Erythrobacter sp.]
MKPNGANVATRKNFNNANHEVISQGISQDLLTPREMEITRLTAQGMTNKEIALALEISHWTVATHLRRIYNKTQIHRRAALGSALVAGQAPVTLHPSGVATKTLS